MVVAVADVLVHLALHLDNLVADLKIKGEKSVSILKQPAVFEKVNIPAGWP